MSTRAILVVEESGLSRATLEGLLPPEGCTVTAAPGYVEALYKLSRERFDLVLTGDAMNEMGGIELLITAKSLGFVETHGNTTRPVFVLLCETTDEAVIRRAWAAGFRHIFSRSVVRARLAEILYDCVGSQGELPALEEVAEGEVASSTEAIPESPLAPPVHRGLISILRIDEEGTTLVYHLGGNLSKGSGYMELRESVLRKVRSDRNKRIILNCREVTYVNSSGIAGLVSLRNEVARWGGELFLTGAQEQVFSVLARLDLLQTLQYRPGTN